MIERGGEVRQKRAMEYPMDYIPVTFSYDLRPGQGIVLVTSRDLIQDE
ncbi:MAG: hypothetical protein JRJ42_06465 [Deltaproteobacteria bacterium]|nr:hypothetical protein [Deltaproteobacteria bacterium]